MTSRKISYATRSVTFKDQYVPAQTRLDTWDAIYGKYARAGKCIACKDTIFVETYCCGFYVSKSKGGTHDIKNIIPLCKKCYEQLDGRGVIEVAPHVTVAAYLASVPPPQPQQPMFLQSTQQQPASNPTWAQWTTPSNVNLSSTNNGSTNNGWHFVAPQTQQTLSRSVHQPIQQSSNQTMGFPFSAPQYQGAQNQYGQNQFTQPSYQPSQSTGMSSMSTGTGWYPQQPQQPYQSQQSHQQNSWNSFSWSRVSKPADPDAMDISP